MHIFLENFTKKLKPISFKNNAKTPIMTKICTIQPNILVRVGLKYEGWIVQIFVIIGGFALFLKEMGFTHSDETISLERIMNLPRTRKKFFMSF